MSNCQSKTGLVEQIEQNNRINSAAYPDKYGISLIKEVIIFDIVGKSLNHKLFFTYVEV